MAGSLCHLAMSTATWLLEMNDIGPSVAKESPFTKTGGDGEAGDDFTGLEVRIEDDFDDCQNAARFKGAKQFGERCRLIRNFTEDGYQNATIKAIEGEPAGTECGGDELDVCVTCRLCLVLGAGKHSRLDIERHDASGRANALGQGNGKASRATPGIQYRHTTG